jgi:hypothetical protein
VPVLTEQTFYTKHGDFLPRFFLVAAALMAIAGILKSRRKNEIRQN